MANQFKASAIFSSIFTYTGYFLQCLTKTMYAATVYIMSTFPVILALTVTYNNIRKPFVVGKMIPAICGNVSFHCNKLRPPICKIV